MLFEAPLYLVYRLERTPVQWLVNKKYLAFLELFGSDQSILFIEVKVSQQRSTGNYAVPAPRPETVFFYNADKAFYSNNRHHKSNNIAYKEHFEIVAVLH